MKYEKVTIGRNGKDVSVDSVSIGNNVLIVAGGPLRIARVKEELYEDVEDPQRIIEALQEIRPTPDILTFCQRLPELIPKFDYAYEWEALAGLPVKSYEDWIDTQVSKDARKLVRRAERKGCVLKQCSFDDEFIEGMTKIFNETPIRQGRPFWHYGKDAATVKREFSRFLFREEIFGAYLENELIGFIFLAFTENYVYLGQIVSKVQHRDKCTNNALIAKAVEVTAQKNIPYLHYGYWPNGGGLEEFKRRHGFQKIEVPRYYVPLTRRGTLAVKLNLHRGVRGVLPEQLRLRLRDLRNKWYEKRYSSG